MCMPSGCIRTVHVRSPLAQSHWRYSHPITHRELVPPYLRSYEAPHYRHDGKGCGAARPTGIGRSLRERLAGGRWFTRIVIS